MSEAFDPLSIARKVAEKRAVAEAPGTKAPEDLRGLLVPGENVEMSDSVKIPDFTEVMVGWRAWNVNRHRLLLESKIRRMQPSGERTYPHWEPREVMLATCHGKYLCRRNGDVPPGQTCGCGLYAAKTLYHLLTLGYSSYDGDTGTFSVIGPVALWGKVIEGSLGWRAQKGYPQKLYIPFEAWEIGEPLSERYGVPFELMNWLD